jgi:penicillin-binding protein 1A
LRLILRFFGFLFSFAAIVFVLAAAAFGYMYWSFSQELPDHAQLANYAPPVTTRVHAGDGTLLAEYSRERRLFIPIQAVPQQVIAAFLSAEDKNFFKHGGIDPEGVARAISVEFSRFLGQRRGEVGGSSITQQVAKNMLLSPEKTYDRKIKEALLALRMEQTYSKERILELYLNQIFLGLGNYGIASAALNYFNKSVHELSLEEAAYLAALPKAPNNYHPFRQPQAAIDRRNWVLDRMLANGYITRGEADTARRQPLNVNPRVLSPNTIAAGYFAEEVRRDLGERYGEKNLYEGGLSVRTTLEPKMQAMARRALVDGLVRFDEARGWRGADKNIELATREWGLALSEIPVLADVQPWKLAVVLEVGSQSARVGLQPRKEASGQVEVERRFGTIPLEGLRWTRKSFVNTLNAGDVVYVEPLDVASDKAQYRLRQMPEISGAIVALDANTGRILAMVGGFSFDQSEFNRATQAMRQPGSSYKPFVYAAALDNGYTPSTVVVDGPIEIDQGPGQEAWRPENYDSKFAGPRTLRYGIEHSKNLMTVRLARDIGMPLITEYSRKFGIYDDLLPVLSMALGAGETTLLRMTAGYAMFVNGGKRIKPTMIDRIQDRYGATIYRHDERQCGGCIAETWSNQEEPKLVDNREQVIDPLTAYQVTSILEGVVQRGTAQVVKEVGKPLAGKTGTTNDAKDVWFVGFSPDLAVGVYLGYDKPRSLGNSATAGQYAAPVFRDFMKMALADKPATPFRVPAGIKLIRVNPATGLRAGAGENSIMEAFKPGTAPPESYAIIGFGNGQSGGDNEVDRAVNTGAGGLY